MTHGPARLPRWLLPLLVLLAFAFQGTRGIWEPDEGRYTATALNMLESGDFLVPTVDGEHPHLTKPPLTYWALAASISLFGQNLWAARVPGALAFIGTGLIVFGLARRFCPAQPGLAALIWALSVAPTIGANVISTDGLLVFFETAAMFAFVEARATRGSPSRRWLLAMWFAWGLAFMTKGPPALLPLFAVVIFLAVHDRACLRRLFDVAGLGLFAVVAFTWFTLVVHQQPDRFGQLLGDEVYDRVFTGRFGRHEQWYGGLEVYVPVFVLGALPWWVLAMVAAGGARGAWRRLRAHLDSGNVNGLLLAYWFCVPLLVFFIAKSRLQLYVLPLFVPLALAFARVLVDWDWLTRSRLRRIAFVTLCGLVAFKGGTSMLTPDRDSSAIAAAIRQATDLRGVEEITFVDMRGFYGLTLYLDLHIESIQTGRGEHLEHSTFVAEQDLCSELEEREANIFAVKAARTERFLAALRRCNGPTLVPAGRFAGDGNALVLYRQAE